MTFWSRPLPDGEGWKWFAHLFLPDPSLSWKNSIFSPDHCWAAKASDVQSHRTELMRIVGCLFCTWGGQLCARGSTPLTISSSVKNKRCLSWGTGRCLSCGQLLKVLYLQRCPLALEDADGVWAPFCLHAGSRADLHCAASHHESLVFGLSNAGHQRAFQVGSGSWWSFFRESWNSISQEDLMKGLW